MYFSPMEKVTLTLLVSFIPLLTVALGFHSVGIEAVADLFLTAAVSCLGTGVVVGALAFLRWVWFDA